MCENSDLIISIGIVALNEEEFVPLLLNDIAKQTYPKSKTELIFIDSGSTDKTYECFESFKAKFEKDFFSINIFKNEKRKQSCGWNIAIRNFKGDALARLDAHARIPEDFLMLNVKYLSKGEKIVGGLRPTKIQKCNKWTSTLLIAEESLFGSSVADYRRIKEEKYVNSMFHACYTKEVLNRVGGFNEYLGRTEDNEFHYRIRKQGYKLYYNSDIKSYQYIRSDLKKMIKQKFGNGLWIGLTLAVSPKCLSIFHFAPFFFVLGIFISLVLSFMGFSSPLFFLLAIYFMFVIINTGLSFKEKDANYTTICLIFIFPVLHIAYGIGTILGICKILFWKDRKKAKFFSNRRSLL